MKKLLKHILYFYVLYESTDKNLTWFKRLKHSWKYSKYSFNYPHLLFLDDYEVANLQALIEAMGYATWNDKEFIPNPLQMAQTGDWVGQIYWKLPDVEHKPNITWQQMATNARNWVLNEDF